MEPVALFLMFALGAGALIALVAILGYYSGQRRDRMLAHEERMKALELGRDIAPAWGSGSEASSAPGDEKGDDAPTGADSADALAHKCFSTAVWVAFWGFVAAGQSFLSGPPGDHKWGVSIAIAAAAGCIGVTAMICGTVIATRAPVAEPFRRHATGKPVVERDAFDAIR